MAVNGGPDLVVVVRSWQAPVRNWYPRAAAVTSAAVTWLFVRSAGPATSCTAVAMGWSPPSIAFACQTPRSNISSVIRHSRCRGAGRVRRSRATHPRRPAAGAGRCPPGRTPPRRRNSARRYPLRQSIVIARDVGHQGNLCSLVEAVLREERGERFGLDQFASGRFDVRRHERWQMNLRALGEADVGEGVVNRPRGGRDLLIRGPAFRGEPRGPQFREPLDPRCNVR